MKDKIQQLKDFFVAYKKYPLSMALKIIVKLAVVLFVGTFLTIIIFMLVKGIPHLKLSMFSLTYSTDNFSMMPAIINTVTIIVFTLLLVMPIGIGTAIYLVEYAKKGSKFVKVIRLTAETLAGIPSIVFALFGYMLFNSVTGYSMIAGIVTLSIMVLPLIIRTTEESLLSVPDTFREGSFGLGAGKLRTIFKIILPSAIQGIFGGVVLSVGRIVGETAALIFTSGMHPQIATSFLDSGRTLAVHMYALFSEGHNTNEAYATGVVLLLVVIGINAISYKIQRKLSLNR